jgi:precorrin-6Y C5,15-methyltransferase (decarboxylating)
MARIFVIGIGYKPLDRRSGEIILNSRYILASRRLFEVFSLYEEFGSVKERIAVINNIGETMDFMKSALKNDDTSTITLLASGDPMFFGIGRRALEEFGKDRCEIIPDMSSMQLAFARIKEPWDDALLMSLHGGPDPGRRRKLEYGIDDIPSLAAAHKRIGILTDKVNNPSAVAKVLVEAYDPMLISGLRMNVCEKLGYGDERITEGSAAQIAAMTFADPNVVIIRNEKLCRGEVPPNTSCISRKADDSMLSLTEDEIEHSRGLITKDEVRAVTLHRLMLPSGGVMWDIGAGSGSVSIEAARLSPGLHIYSIEKDSEQIGCMKSNRDRFGLRNMKIVEGTAPEALHSLPAPDRIFIGGSGGRIEDIVAYASGRMETGVVVINAATVETFTLALSALKDSGYSVEASQVSISRMKPLGEGHFFSAQNPVFVIRGRK